MPRKRALIGSVGQKANRNLIDPEHSLPDLRGLPQIRVLKIGDGRKIAAGTTAAICAQVNRAFCPTEPLRVRYRGKKERKKDYFFRGGVWVLGGFVAFLLDSSLLQVLVFS